MQQSLESTSGRRIDRRLARDPVAIVGLSALYPKARNLHEFWANVVSASDCMEHVPADHWDVSEFYDPDPSVPDKTYCRRGGFIPDTPFNALEFGITPNTLEVTDVLQLLSLVVARDLLKDAGAGQAWYDKSRTGVVLGITGANQLTQPLTARLQSPVLKEVVRSCGLSDRDAEEIAAKFRLAYAPWEENSFPGMLGNVVAGRIANRLDLGGINMTIDAACASSLGAVRVGISELLEGRADTMLVGGCDAENTIFMYLCFSKTPALSKAGNIRPFDKDADGTLIGEGIGMLALRRLSDAERDGNRIYAVIRGIGTSSDGRFKSIYAPREEGQTVAIRRAYEDADCSPATVELFEAHGTGTAVGDATELKALSAVVTEASDAQQYAAVGSVKSQIGHTKAAAGAAGMIKLALALHHKLLPPTINVSQPTTAIDFVSGPFYVNTRTRPWIRDPHRPNRRAAISSFGFGGTNFHVVMEERGNGDDLKVRFPVARVSVWHASDQAGLMQVLESGAPVDGGPVPDTDARLALVYRDDAELAALREVALGELRANPDADSWAHPKGAYFRRRALKNGVGDPSGGFKVAALFAGQGSQYVNLGLEAVLALPPLRAAFDRVNQLFEGTEPLSRIAFPPPSFDPAQRSAQEDKLRLTENAQVAIGALSAGQFRYLTELGFAADGFLGHSFGELTALWAAGTFDDATFFKLARARGLAMAPRAEHGSDPGTMAAISAPEDKVAALLADHAGVLVCNRNAQDQIVVGGATEDVERLVAAASKAGLRASRLPVAAAFHTPFVAHAVEEFRTHVDAAEMRVPRGKVFANTRGASYGPDIATNRKILAEQLAHQVDFANRVEEMYAEGFRVFVEFGPKALLTQLVHRILGDRPHTALTLDAGPGNDADVAVKRAVAQLAVLGLPVETADKYTAPPLEAAPTKGMFVGLNGINYVSPERKAAYREALEAGYRVAIPAPAPAGPPPAEPATPVAVPAPRQAAARPAPAPPAATGPAPVRATVPVAVPAGPAPTATAAHSPVTMETATMDSDRLAEIASSHLALHDEYLTGQLQCAERLTGLLERAASQSREETVLPGVTSVKDHGLAIGHTHLRATEILRELAELEFGASPRATTIRVESFVSPDVPTVPAISNGTAPAVPNGISAVAPAPVIPAPAPAFAPVAVAPAPVATAPAAAASPAPGGPDGPAVQAAVLEVVGEKTGYPPEMLEPDMDIEADLGIDSIKRVEIMGVLQERFPGASPSASPEQLGELRTLRNIIEFMSGPAGAAPNGPEPAPDDGEPLPKGIGRAQAALVTLPALDRLVNAYPRGAAALVVDDGAELASAIADRLARAGRRVHVLRLPGVPAHTPGGQDHALSDWGEAAIAGQLKTIGAGGISLVVDVHAAAQPDWPSGVRRLQHTLLLAKHLVGPLTTASAAGRAAFITVTTLDGRFGLGGVAETDIPAGGVVGLPKTMAIEAPGVFCRAVDLSPSLDAAAGASLVIDEAEDLITEPVQVGHDGERRVGLALADEPLNVPQEACAPLTPDDLLVVTGGGRGITAACVIELARRYRPRLILVGRTPLEDEPGWASGVEDAALKAAAVAGLKAAGEKPTPKGVERLLAAVLGTREIRRTLQALAEAGSQAEYLAADISDPEATEAALAPYREQVTGLVHGAGVLADQLIAKKKAAEIERVFAPKLTGLWSVISALSPGSLRHVVLFSSVAGFFGNLGQSDYAMANEVLNAWASSWKQAYPGTRVTSLNWGAWDSGMVSGTVRAIFEERGIILIPAAVGARMFAQQFDPRRAHDVVTVLGPTTPLSEPDTAPPAAEVTVERQLGDLTRDPMLADHVIGGSPVLPAAVALGWAIGAVERLSRRVVRHVRDFAVHKGIVFDGTQPDRCQMVIAPSGDAWRAAIRSDGPNGKMRPHYAAVVSGQAAGPEATVADLPPLGGGRDAADFYCDGTLFHGPSLRGIRRVLAEAESRLVLECALAEHRPAGGAFSGALFGPGTADLLLQAGLVWVRLFRGSAGLPLSVSRVDLFRPLPDGEPFLVVAEPASAGNGSGSLLTITACGPDGRVLTRLDGLLVIADPQLAAKFVLAEDRPAALSGRET